MGCVLKGVPPVSFHDAHLVMSIFGWWEKEGISFSFFFFWQCHVACGILFPWPGIEPISPALALQSLNHWTTSDVREDCSWDSGVAVQSFGIASPVQLPLASVKTQSQEAASPSRKWSSLPDRTLPVCLYGMFVIEGPGNWSMHWAGRASLRAGFRPRHPLCILEGGGHVDCYLLTEPYFQRKNDLEGPWEPALCGWV